MRNSRQITVLRSLFKTLHPILESGLAPARRLLTGTQEQLPDPQPAAAGSTRSGNGTEQSTATTPTTTNPEPAPQTNRQTKTQTSTAPERTLTDEHLVTELENITREIPRAPQRGRRHYSRDSLLSLLEEAKVRIQVLETELELARGTDEHIPLLTEEWSDDLPSTHARKPD